jgi:hypothetical protein
VRLRQRQELFGAQRGLVVITLVTGQHGRPVQRLAQRNGPGVGHGQGLGEPGTPFAVVAADEPEAPQGCSEVQERIRVALLSEPAQGEPKVGVIGLEPGQPRELV